MISETYSLLGKKSYYRNKSENKNKIYRRSVFAVKDISKGEKFTKQNIRRIRPGHGVPPIYYQKIINKKSPVKLKIGEPINFKILKKIGIKK